MPFSLVLSLRPVHFAGEFFTVLEHGHRANLSICRFTQEKGAASSFLRVIEALELACEQKGLLVADPDKAKKMGREMAKIGH